MRKFITCSMLVFFQIISHCQNDVVLNITGKLDHNKFELNKVSTNNLGNKFDFTRLDYLISGIKIYHDGLVTNFNDKYIFVNQGKDVSLLLGNIDIIQLDSITIYIGVDSINNHSDPTGWHASHPLAPKSPDMHWGWAAGYRFIAIEGNSGNNNEYFYQLHTLGDQLYKPTTITTNGFWNGNTLNINLNADYSKAMENIKLNKNVLIHGSHSEAARCLENFNNLIFSEGEKLSSTHETKISTAEIYPSISSEGIFNITELSEQSAISVFDFNGKQLFRTTKHKSGQNLVVDESGIFLIQVVDENNNIFYQKIIVQKN